MCHKLKNARQVYTCQIYTAMRGYAKFILNARQVYTAMHGYAYIDNAP